MTIYFKTHQKGLCLFCVVSCTVSGAKGELKVVIYWKNLSWEDCSAFFIESIKLGFLHSNIITPAAVADGTKGRSTLLDFVQSTCLVGMMQLKSGRYIIFLFCFCTVIKDLQFSRVSLARISSPCQQGSALPWRNQRAAWTVSPFLFSSWGCQKNCQTNGVFYYVDTTCQVQTGHRLSDSYLTV